MPAVDPTKSVDRQAEVQALESQLSRESAFRERQAEVDRRTQGEIEARERLEQLEKEIYTERSGLVLCLAYDQILIFASGKFLPRASEWRGP
jgi:hypothetical protein